jgi:hypothetical protein
MMLAAEGPAQMSLAADLAALLEERDPLPPLTHLATSACGLPRLRERRTPIAVRSPASAGPPRNTAAGCAWATRRRRASRQC